MQGVILAAGKGERLQEMTTALPKALVSVAGKPLITYAIAFARLAGCSEIIVVVGSFYKKLIAFIEALEFPYLSWVQNTRYHLGNLYSLSAACKKIRGDFLLLNTDHIYKRRVAACVHAQCKGLVAFCDKDRNLGNDDMKVALDQRGRLANIAKNLTKFDCGYVGITFCQASYAHDYWAAFDWVAKKYGDKAVVEYVLRELALRNQSPDVGDISGCGWLEIDTPYEHARAEASILAEPDQYEQIEDCVYDQGMRI